MVPMPRAQASPEIKAAALADLFNGDQPSVVAQRYNLNPSTVRAWKDRHVADIATRHASASATRPPPDIALRQVHIVELVYDNLIAKLTASRRLADHVQSPAWLEKQTAEGVAILGQWLDSTAANTLALLAGHENDTPSADK